MFAKEVLLCAILPIGLATAARAADLPTRRTPPQTDLSPTPAFSWTGFYAGGNLGGGFDDYATYGLGVVTPGAMINLEDGTRAPFRATNSSGFIGGGQIGYNLQFRNGLFDSALGNGLGPLQGGGVVVGVEADADYTDLRATGTYIGGPASLASQYLSRTDFIGTVRGRLGYAFGNLLVYGTGGLAYGGVRDNLAIFSSTGGLYGVSGVNQIQTGIAYGGGAEFAIPTASALNVFKSSAVTLKVEYLHYVLGADVGILTNSVNHNVYTTRILNDGNLVRAGLNYKFDFNPAPIPVVARY